MTDLDTFESLLNCRSVDELHAATAEIVRRIGFDRFAYSVQVNVSPTRCYQFLLIGSPKEWRSDYVEARCQDADPAIFHGIKHRRMIPILWDVQDFSSRPAARLVGEANEFGLASGASFAVYGSQGEAAVLNLTTSRNPQQADQDIGAMLGKGQLLACYLHEAVQNIVLRKETLPLKKIALTSREKECLLWAAEGKTTREIANIIRTSQRTVIFHLQNAARKMGVASRQHAVARAISMGLAAP